MEVGHQIYWPLKRSLPLAVLGALGPGLLFGAPQAASATTPSYSISSFTAHGYDNVSPGEPTIAVGKTYIVETINPSFTVYTKSGSMTSHREFSSFFPDN